MALLQPPQHTCVLQDSRVFQRLGALADQSSQPEGVHGDLGSQMPTLSLAEWAIS